jgi:6-methylsalicylate decarboxylase
MTPVDELSSQGSQRRAALRGAGLLALSSLYAACGEAREEARGPSGTNDGGAPPQPAPDASPADVRDGSTDMATQPDAARPSVPLPARARELVDVHAHFVPDAYRAAAQAAGYDLTRYLTFSPWTLDDHLTLADGLGVRVSVLSLPAPGVYFGDDARASLLARTLNDEAAAVVARAAERLRFFAALPLPDVNAAVAELARAQALPGCVGAVVYAGGISLGEARLDPLWKALDDAGAAVLVHPQLPEPTLRDLSLEGAFTIARAAMELFEARVITRFARARFILAGAGGILPGVLDRIQTFGLAGYTIPPDQTKQELAGLYFDCAGAVLSTQLPALLKQVPITRLLYGSDSGALPQPALAELATALDGELAAAPGKTLRAHCIENGRAFTLG